MENKALQEHLSGMAKADLADPRRSKDSTLMPWPFPPDVGPSVTCTPERHAKESRNNTSRRSQQRYGTGGLSVSRDGHSDTATASTADIDTTNSSHGRWLPGMEGADTGAGDRGGRRERRQRPTPIVTSFPQQSGGVTALGVVVRSGSAGGPNRVRVSRSSVSRSRRASVGEVRKAGGGAAASAAVSLASGSVASDVLQRSKHRPRRRFKTKTRSKGGDSRADGQGAGASAVSPPDGEEREGKMRRPRSWTGAILRSPTLGGSLAWALHPGSRRVQRGRARSDTQGTSKSADGVTDSSTVTLNEDESLSDVGRAGAESDSAGIAPIRERLKLAVDEDLIRRAFESP